MKSNVRFDSEDCTRCPHQNGRCTKDNKFYYRYCGSGIPVTDKAIFNGKKVIKNYQEFRDKMSVENIVKSSSIIAEDNLNNSFGKENNAQTNLNEPIRNIEKPQKLVPPGITFHGGSFDMEIILKPIVLAFIATILVIIFTIVVALIPVISFPVIIAILILLSLGTIIYAPITLTLLNSRFYEEIKNNSCSRKGCNLIYYIAESVYAAMLLLIGIIIIMFFIPILTIFIPNFILWILVFLTTFLIANILRVINCFVRLNRER